MLHHKQILHYCNIYLEAQQDEENKQRGCISTVCCPVPHTNYPQRLGPPSMPTCTFRAQHSQHDLFCLLEFIMSQTNTAAAHTTNRRRGENCTYCCTVSSFSPGCSCEIPIVSNLILHTDWFSSPSDKTPPLFAAN